MSARLPSAGQAKDQAKRLRTKMAEDGIQIGHAKSLELIAHQHGFRDWNTMFAALGNKPHPGWSIGDIVKGRYLSQAFTADVIVVTVVKPGWFRLELRLEEAVDVVTSDGFSNFRRRIRGLVGPKGYSIERTSNGEAQLQVDL